MSSRFLAWLDRLRWIKRWGLMRNQIEENVMEHSWQVATIAHLLAVIHNRYFNGSVNAERVATMALYHDISEVITGDMPTPIKYHSPTITQAYKAIEKEAEAELLDMLPEPIRDELTPFVDSNQHDDLYRFVKWADMICAWLKCQAELKAGNQEFATAAVETEAQLRAVDSQELNFFLSNFTDSYELTLDELLVAHDQDENHNI